VKKSPDKLPPLWLSIIPLVILVSMTAFCVYVFGEDVLNGASQIALITGAAVTVAIGVATGYMNFADFEEAVNDKIASVGSAIIILLLIGALGGAWMVSGVVPTLICYGLEILRPEWFLPSACVISAIVSLMTGSSWTTIATIGLALIGVGVALGFSPGWVAGAIISGAYFGDKISPLSDTTVLASSTVGTPLFTHIHYMLRTTVPSILVTLVVYTVVGLFMSNSLEQQTDGVRSALDVTFNLSPWLLLVPLFTAVLIAKRMPAMVVLFLAVVMACVAAVIAQRPLLYQIAGSEETGIVSAFRGMMQMVYGNTALETGVDGINSLVATRGMAGMMGTIWLIICAMLFAGALTASRMLESMMRALLRMAKNVFSLVTSTAITGCVMNILVADQYMSIVLSSSLFKESFRKMGLESRLLSRTVEDSVTVTSVLVPWNTCGMTQSSVLGVSVIAYAPFAVFCYLSPISTIIASAFLQRKYKKQESSINHKSTL